MTSPRQRLRQLLEAGETIVAPGCHDPLTARLVQRLGFPCGYVGGWMTGAHLATTEPLTTLTEQVEVARRIARAVDIPVIVDGGAGFGDPVHTMRTVREFEDAGVAGIHLEDQVYPKRVSYHRGREHIVSREEFYTKIRYALRARRDPDFLIIARSDALRAVDGSMEELVQRTRDARELGADVAMPLVQGLEQQRQFREAYGPFDYPMLVAAYYNEPSVQEIAALGYQIIIYPLAGILTAVGSVLDVYRGLKETGIARLDAEWAAATRREIEEAIDLPQYFQVEDETTERA